MISNKKAIAASHTQAEAVNWAKSQIDKGLDYDKENGNQCVDLIKYYYDYFGVAEFAKGNADKYATNDLPPGWARVYGNYQPGDVGVWVGCHVGIITSIDSVGFNAVNQNYSNTPHCTENWFKINVLQCAIRPNFSAPQISHNPEGCLDILEGGLNSVHIRGWVFDHDSLASSIPIHVYMDDVYVGAGVADQKRTDVNNVYGCGEYHGFDFKLPVKSSGTHAFKVFAINIGTDGQPSGQGNPLLGGASVSIVVDETPPVISDIKVIDQDSSGYTIECKATDNRGIDRVQCPTWTVANGQDDLQEDWWTNVSVKATSMGDGIYQFRVNISDHNSEHGLYITHIYAYDEAGNHVMNVVDDIEVFEDSRTITPGDINQDGNIDGKDIGVSISGGGRRDRKFTEKNN